MPRFFFFILCSFSNGVNCNRHIHINTHEHIRETKTETKREGEILKEMVEKSARDRDRQRSGKNNNTVK